MARRDVLEPVPTVLSACMRSKSLHLPGRGMLVRMALLGRTAHEPAAVVPGSQRRPDNRAWAIGLDSGGWLKLILLRVPQESPKVTVLGADRPFSNTELHRHRANQTYPKTDTGPN